jgi:peptidoglycan/xylan/chitin deacetylase (PgdA/CDA1 family)
MTAAVRELARLLANSGMRAAALGAVACAVAIPAYAYWHSTRARPHIQGRPTIRFRPATLQGQLGDAMNARYYYGLATQVSLPLPRESGIRAVPDYHGGVIVLCYHDISARPHNRYTVTPAAFAAQMAALRASGFHTIGAATLAAYLDGARVSLPRRPLLLTFDDGAKGTWIYADPILRRLGYRATVFLITGDVSHHQPYYLDWSEVEAMARSGRWSFGSHTYKGHGLVATDGRGDTGPFLINRKWLARAKRMESLAEYARRITHDIGRSIRDIEAHGLPRPRLFAYPFSAAVDPTDDPRTRAILERLLAERFSALMDNTPRALLVRAGMRGPLPRVEVFHGERPRQLLEQIAHAIERKRVAS